MNNKLLLVINPLLGLSVLVQAMTLILPKVFGIKSMALFQVHEINGYVFFALVVVHLSLNAWWVKSLFAKKAKKKK